MQKQMNNSYWVSSIKPNLRSELASLQSLINTDALKDRTGKPLTNCISKNKALRLTNKRGSLGLLIHKRVIGSGYKFSDYSGGELGEREFVIDTATINDFFSGSPLFSGDSPDKKSLIVYRFPVNFILVEISGNECNDTDPGGDGVKVKLPTEQ